MGMLSHGIVADEMDQEGVKHFNSLNVEEQENVLKYGVAKPTEEDFKKYKERQKGRDSLYANDEGRWI